MNYQKYTKQFFGRILLSLLILLLTGCNEKEEPIKKTIPSPSPTPVVTQTPTPADEIVGQASTKIFDNIPARNRNLALAIQAINKKVLSPGEEFSFNQTVGPRTKENGYREATGYNEHGEKEQTVGGGICQISSTLYMAAKDGGFTITERHSHSHSVPYADSEHDATVSYEGYDFRFQNNRDKPVLITVATNGESVTVKLILINSKKSP